MTKSIFVFESMSSTNVFPRQSALRYHSLQRFDRRTIAIKPTFVHLQCDSPLPHRAGFARALVAER
jgi:hypothetical protein